MVPVNFPWRLRGFQRRACGARIMPQVTRCNRPNRPSIIAIALMNCRHRAAACQLRIRSRTLPHLPDQLPFPDVSVIGFAARLCRPSPRWQFCVPMIWRHDVHHINGRIINDFPIITALVNRSARPLPRNNRLLLLHGTINITHRDDIAKLETVFQAHNWHWEPSLACPTEVRIQQRQS